MQLNIYVRPEDETNVRIIKGLAQLGEASTSEMVHEAIAIYLTLRGTFQEINETALARGLSATELVNAALEEYLTLHQEV